MFVNCTGQMYVENEPMDTVDEFKYLGLIISNNVCKPEVMLKARINKA